MTQLLQNAAYGTALILTAAVLRRVLKDRLVPGARLALWTACLFRLLTPAAPESALSLWGLPRLFSPEGRTTPAPAAAGFVLSRDGSVPAPAPAPQPDPGIFWETALLAVWLMVGVALAARYALSWRRTRRAVACAIPLDRDDPQYAPLPKCARLRVGPMEGAPLTFGVIRPTVVLSPGLSGAELDCVLAHEGVHAQRRDNLWHYAMALALAVHWWNPAVWLMARLLRRDIELSCDRAALKKLGADRRADYANALVSLAVQGAGPAFCQTFGRKAAEERILSIMKFKKNSVIGAVLSLTLVLAVTVAFASAPKEPDGVYDNIKTQGATYVEAIWIPDVEETQDVQSDYTFVDPDSVNLSMMRERLAQQVADGELTQKAADVELARIESLLEAARQGYAKLILDDAGLLYGMGVGQLVRGEDLGGGYFLAEDGTLYCQNEDGSWSKSDTNQYEVEGAPRTSSGLHALCGAVDCDIADPHYHDGSGKVVYVHYQNPYEDPFAGVIGGGGSTSGILAAAPAPSIGPEPTNLVNTAPSTSCGVEGCTETRYHQHTGGYTFLLSDPCPVEGCTILGTHLHGDVCYSCNGAGHSGGVCDGSCLVYNSLPAFVDPSESAGSHHSESHHSGSHH